MTDPLDEPRPSFTRSDSASLLGRLYGLSGELTELHGERDLNFRVDASDGRRYVLKIHNPADSVEVIDMRTQAMAHIRRVDPDLPVPDLAHTRDGDSVVSVTAPDGRMSHVQMFTFLDGHSASRDELDEQALYDWGARVAALGRALRGFFHPAAGYAIQWDLRHAGKLRDRLSFVDDDHRAVVREVLDRFDARVGTVLPRLRAQVVHNDMSRGNVLVDEAAQIVGITDFGDMTHTALVCDVAITLADVLDGRPDSLRMTEPMIAGYCSLTQLDSDEAAVLGDLVATRLATSLVVSAWRSARHPDAPGFPRGAVEFLSRIEKEGFDDFSSRLRRAARSSSPELPYQRRPSRDLLAARRRVLGRLGLTYDEPLHLLRGAGVHVFDADGRRYLDAYNNVPVVGHCHPDVVDAITAQARTLVTNTRYLHEASIELAEQLLASAPGELERVLFVNSGSEANDIAWRIARFATGRRGALVTQHAYHGLTEATTDLSPEEWPDGYAPAHVGLLPPPSAHPVGVGTPSATGLNAVVEQLERSGHRPAALFVDPAFTSDGILGPASGWLAPAVAALHEAGGYFVADEVQAGYGRTGGSLWSISPSGVAPDLVTLGKPMGNGFPVAAVLGRADLVDRFVEETGYFSTFGGNTLACAAALAVLRVIEEQRLVEHAALVGSHLRHLLDEVAARHEFAGPVRGWGLLCGLDIVAPDGAPDATKARQLTNRMRDLGVLVGTTGRAESTLKIRPPLVFQNSDADFLAERLDTALTAS